MRRLRPLLPIALLLVGCSALCFADTLSEGRALYKAGRYQEAVVKLQQAVKEEPNNAKAWWQLNFAYNKLGRYSDALAAVKKAGAADPAHTFASDPGKYAETLGRLQSKAGKRTESRASQRQTGSSGSNLTQVLMTGDVYVAPGMPADAVRLQAVANGLRPTVVKFVVFNSTEDASVLSREANRVRDYLKEYINQGQGYVIVASRRGVAVSSSSLSKRDLASMAKQAAPKIGGGDYTGGLESLARALVRTKAARAEALTGVAAGESPRISHTSVFSMTWLWILVGIVAVIVVVSSIRRSVKRSRRMAEMRRTLERQKGEVISDLNTLDEAIPGLPAATASHVKEARVAAGTKLDEAARALVRGRSEVELQHAQTLLDAAQTDLAGARSAIGRAQGASASAPGGAVPPVYPSATVTDGQTDWSQVPDSEKGVCFFCSRPSLLRELTPVTVRLDDQPQKVLACAADLATIKSGQMPSIRAFQRGGRAVPWYADDDYNPYRDYYSRGYDSRSLFADMVMLSMIDDMFWGWRHPMGWGWGGGYGYGYGGYPFYAEHEVYRDYYSSEAAGAAAGDASLDAGGADFLQDVDAGSGADLGRDQS